MTATMMEALALAGRIIMEYGGETYRVEETVVRMGHSFGLQNVETFAVPSGLFISCEREDGGTETRVQRIRQFDTDYTKVDAVNRISRQMEHSPMEPEEVLKELRDIADSKPRVSLWMTVLAVAFSSAGFTLMFWGSWLDAVVSGITGGLVQYLMRKMESRSVKGMSKTFLGSLFTALIPSIALALSASVHLEPTIAGALMPLLPGVAMTNAVSDTMRGDYVSGVTHALRALLTAAMIAGGALIGTSVPGVLGGIL